jgi:hypothetical protein
VSVPRLLRCARPTHYPTPCVADPGATMTFVAGGALKPIGGHILSHASATRIFLRKGKSRQFGPLSGGLPTHFTKTLSLSTLRMLELLVQVVRRSASRSSSIAQTNPSVKPHTSSMKGAGQMSDAWQIRWGSVESNISLQPGHHHLPVP